MVAVSGVARNLDRKGKWGVLPQELPAPPDDDHGGAGAWVRQVEVPVLEVPHQSLQGAGIRAPHPHNAHQEGPKQVKICLKK